MAGRPFTVSSPEATIARRPDGRFTKVVAPTPAQMVQQYGAAQGITHGQAQRAAAVPMSDVGPGAPRNVGGNGNAPAPMYNPSIPWPDLETGPLPFRNLR